MDNARFDALTRTLRSRRNSLGALLGSLAVLFGPTAPDVVTAHDPVPACRKIADPKKRRQCRRGARTRNRRHVPVAVCSAEPAAVTCGGRCGSYANNCGVAVACPFGPDRDCLSNGSCARTCPALFCPPGCKCLTPVEGGNYCVPSDATCPDMTQERSATTDCPLGQFCLATGCGTPPGTIVNRCAPLCQS